MSFINLSLNDLADLCQQETQKFFRKEPHDTKYCFEIFRQAFSDQNDEAVTKIHQLYQWLIYKWVRNHSAISQLDFPAEDFVIESLQRFIASMRKHSFERFKTVAAILQYLKRCVDTTLLAALRKQKRQVLASESLEYLYSNDLSDSEDPYISNIDAILIWKRIEAILDKESCLLARYALLQDLKPRQICELNPEIWATPNDVRVSIQRMKRKLRSDPQMQKFVL